MAEARRLGAPGDDIGRLAHTRLRSQPRENLARIARAGLVDDVRGLLALAETVADAPTPIATTLVRGDLYAAHLGLTALGHLRLGTDA